MDNGLWFGINIMLFFSGSNLFLIEEISWLWLLCGKLLCFILFLKIILLEISSFVWLLKNMIWFGVCSG